MRHIGRILWVALALSVLVQPATAQDRRFAVRLGVVASSPTSDTVVAGVSAELGTAFGGEFNFEWYINQHLGLEASVAFATDTDIESSDDMTVVSGISVLPATIGLNAHVIRSENVDWYIGVLAGAVRYGDFDVVSGGGSGSGSTNKIDTSGAFGAQTAVDIAIGSNDRWGVNIGIKYLESKIEPEDPTLNTVQVDPVNYRVMAVFRF